MVWYDFGCDLGKRIFFTKFCLYLAIDSLTRQQVRINAARASLAILALLVVDAASHTQYARCGRTLAAVALLL